MPFRRKIISIGVMSSRAPETCCGVEWSPLLFNAHEAPVIFGPDDWMHCYMLMPPKCLCSHHLQLGATHRSGEQHSSASIPARNTNNPQTEVEILRQAAFLYVQETARQGMPFTALKAAVCMYEVDFSPVGVSEDFECSHTVW